MYSMYLSSMMVILLLKYSSIDQRREGLEELQYTDIIFLLQRPVYVCMSHIDSIICLTIKIITVIRIYVSFYINNVSIYWKTIYPSTYYY